MNVDCNSKNLFLIFFFQMTLTDVFFPSQLFPPTSDGWRLDRDVFCIFSCFGVLFHRWVQQPFSSGGSVSLWVKGSEIFQLHCPLDPQVNNTRQCSNCSNNSWKKNRMVQLRRRSCDGRKVKIQYLKYYSEISVIGGRGQMLHPISVN